MARAVNQTVAWIAALILSLIVFGIGLGIVFALKPGGGKLDPGHDAASAHKNMDDGHSAPHHPADSETGHAKPKIEHEDPHANEEHDEETEITPASVKAKAGEHSPDAAHH